MAICTIQAGGYRFNLMYMELKKNTALVNSGNFCHLLFRSGLCPTSRILPKIHSIDVRQIAILNGSTFLVKRIPHATLHAAVDACRPASCLAGGGGGGIQASSRSFPDTSITSALFNFGDRAHAGGIGFGQIHDFEQCQREEHEARVASGTP